MKLNDKIGMAGSKTTQTRFVGINDPLYITTVHLIDFRLCIVCGNVIIILCMHSNTFR